TTAYQAKNSSISSVNKRYRYTGKERDDETGLYYHGARYYIPWLCRWMAVDPLESKYAPQSGYVYCSDSPINNLDPDGQKILGLQDLVNSASFKDEWKIVSKGRNFRIFINQFVDENEGENPFNANGRGRYRNIDLQVGPFPINNIVHHRNGTETALNDMELGFTRILYRGFDIREYSSSDLRNINKDELKIDVRFNLSNNRSSQQLLTITHELVLHTSILAKLIDKFKADPSYTIEKFLSDYASDIVHLNINLNYPLYENVNNDIAGTLKANPDLNVLERYISDEDLKQAKRHETFKLIMPEILAGDHWYNNVGLNSVLQRFEFDRAMEKNSFNPSRAGMFGNQLLYPVDTNLLHRLQNEQQNGESSRTQ
ncbi:MAG: RHS repeat-associated core domain-containing protein, partial [Sphingobacteriales bacterium]